VPKKPLASWMRLVAMISVVICARIRPLDCIGSPFSGGLWRKTTAAKATRSCHHHAPPYPFTARSPIIVTGSVGELPSFAPAGLVYADVESAAGLACFGGAFGCYAAAYQPSGSPLVLSPRAL